MTWYRTGTITLTNGATLVQGVGSSFLSTVNAGDMFIGPLLDVYEVSGVQSDGQLQLATPYAGPSYTGPNWAVAPTTANLKQLATQIASLVAIYQDVPSGVAQAQAAVTQTLANKVDAQTSATAAAGSATSAQTFYNQTVTQAGNAAASATAAAGSATDALASKTTAEASETNAANSASAAATSATNAHTSETNAAASAASAAASAASVSGASVTSVAGRTGAVTLTKSDVGLGNVDNTTDANKPVSTAQATAISAAVSALTKASVGLANVDNTADSAKPVSTTQQTALDLKANLTALPNPNMLDNSDMMFNQRSLASVTATPGGGAGSTKFPADRWQIQNGFASGVSLYGSSGTYTGGSAPSGSAKYMHLQPQGSARLPNAGECLLFTQNIEGVTLSSASWGAPNGKTLTLSFDINAAVPGTYCVAIRNNLASPNAWSYVAEVVITGPQSATWVRKTVVIPPPPASSSWNRDNTIALGVSFCFACGTTYGSATANTWTNDNMIATANQSQLSNNTSAVTLITGVKLEVGSVATKYSVPDFQTEYLRLQRYFRVCHVSHFSGMVYLPNGDCRIQFASFGDNPMRTNPSIYGGSLVGATFSILMFDASTETGANCTLALGASWGDLYAYNMPSLFNASWGSNGGGSSVVNFSCNDTFDCMLSADI